MTAEPFLTLAARCLSKHRLDAVLIGNAAAALQGSPVTTLDLDFMFRKTPANLARLRRVADDLEAIVLRPYYPASGLFRIVRDRDGLQFNFMSKIDGRGELGRHHQEQEGRGPSAGSSDSPDPSKDAG